LSEAAAPKPRHVFLIDASGYIFRAYHALPPLTRADGTPTSAVLGFVNMILKLLETTDADHVAAVFDSARVSFRNEIYDQYKANRTDPPDDLVPQFALVREACDAFDLCRIEAPNFEADDLIATYAREAREAGAEVTIVSSDKDLMQLVRDGVVMFDPIKERTIGDAEVQEKFGVLPDKVIDVQALCGDSIDNVPGVPGIGVKTAAELITQYGSLEALLERAHEIKQPKRRERLIEHRENAILSKRLVTLDVRVEPPCPLSALAVKPYDRAKVIAFLSQNDFRKVIQRLEAGRYARAGNGANGVGAAAAPLPEAAPDDFGERRYELVQDLATLDRWIAEAEKQGFVALEVLTSQPEAAMLEAVGIALALAPGRAGYIPLAHVTAAQHGQLDLAALDLPTEPPRQIPPNEAMARLKRLFENPSVLKIGHNVKYFAHVLGGYGVAVVPYDCTELLSYVLDGAQHSHALDDLAHLHLRHEMVKYKDLCGSGKAQIGFALVPIEKARDYAAECADVSLRLHRRLRPRLVGERMTAFYETVERRMPAVIAPMEREGIRVDRVELSRLSNSFARRMGELEAEIYGLAGTEFNLGSPKQLGEILFEKLQLPGGKKTKTGAYSTDAAILEQLALTHDLPRRVLDWRQLSKLKSTYTDALVEQINPQTGRVHTCFSLAATSTGRLSSTEPNLQNIPIRTEEGRKIRRAFVAEPGHVLLSADYSQIELRLAAHVAEIDALKDAFVKGHDIHALTASEVFGVPMDQLDRETRRRAKAINFGIIYGISAFGLAAQLAIPPAEASQYIKAYFSRFPGIRDYMDRTKELCRAQGYVETLFGRKCFIPGIRDPNMARRQGAERQAINAPLQGTAADIIKRAMGRMPKRLAAAGLRARMLLQVHDELLFEVPEGEAERTAAVVKEVMEAACAPGCTLTVPLVVETGAAANWDDAH
jgi:DNA polymerase-1